MVWTLDMDDYLGTFCNQGKYPLINVLKKGLNLEQACKTFNFIIDGQCEIHSVLRKSMLLSNFLMFFSLCPACHSTSSNRRSECDYWRQLWRQLQWRQLLRWGLGHQRHGQRFLCWKGQWHVPRPNKQEPILQLQQRQDLL